METGKTGKYLKYAVGEVILVVTGILIALQINNWNENKKIQAQTLEYIQNIRADIINDTLTIDSLITKGQDQLKQIESFKTFFRQKNNSVEVLLDSSIILSIGTFYRYLPNNQTFADMQSSGNSSLLSQEQRKALINLQKNQEQLSLVNSKIIDFALTERTSRNKYISTSQNFYENINIKPNKDIIVQALIHEYNYLSHREELAGVIKRFGTDIKEKSKKALELLE